MPTLFTTIAYFLTMKIILTPEDKGSLTLALWGVKASGDLGYIPILYLPQFWLAPRHTHKGATPY